MRLSQWRAAAPDKEAMAVKVMAVVEPVLGSFAVGDDPESWVAWGEEPAHRYTILVPASAGLVTCYVRVNVPGQGPRATAKLTRWGRVQLGELSVETQGGHRLLTFQVEQLVLRGTDVAADRIAVFAMELFAAVDGRPPPERRPAAGSRARAGAGRATAAKTAISAGRAAAVKPAAAKPAAAKPRELPARTGSARPAPTRPPTTRRGAP